MDAQRSALRRSALALVALIAWVGVLLQLYLSARLPLSSGKSVVEGLVGFFGYFTVLTNIFVALAAALPVMFGRSRLGRWFGTGMVLGCAVTAIVLVGVGYHFLLRNVWAPQGLQWIADVMLHYVVPMAYFAYWIDANTHLVRAMEKILGTKEKGMIADVTYEPVADAKVTVGDFVFSPSVDRSPAVAPVKPLHPISPVKSGGG